VSGLTDREPAPVGVARPGLGGPRPPALLLDSGGVLMLVDGRILSSYAGRSGVRVSAARARRAVSLAARDRDFGWPDGPPGGPEHEAFARQWALHAGCPPEVGVALWEAVAREVPDTVLWGVVNPDARALLERLPRTTQRYVISNARGHAYAELAQAGLLDQLDGVLDSHVVGVAKPDPRIFRMAAVALDRPLDTCWYLTDTLDGAPAGHPATLLYDPYGIYPDGKGRYERVRTLGEVARMPAFAHRRGATRGDIA